MLILDVEGHEAVAIDGVQRYSPHKLFMEEKMLKPPGRPGTTCTFQDQCYNFDPQITAKPPHIYC
jgi:hypothetical protein